MNDQGHSIEGALTALFPEDSAAVWHLVTRNLGYPIGSDHVEMIDELAGSRLDTADLNELRLAYVLHSAYYFLLDSVTDDHAESPSDATYLTLLLNGAVTTYLRFAQRAGAAQFSRTSQLLLEYSSANARAVRMEWDLFSTPSHVALADEYVSNVGRSNSVLFFYEFLCVIGGHSSDPAVLELLSQTIHLIQLGDDLSDWRQDFASGRYTSVIRTCIESEAGDPDYAQVEKALLLDGKVEAWLVDLVNLNEGLCDGYRHARQASPRMISFLEARTRRLTRALEETVAAKLQVRA